jgi:hypothetical protein
VIILLFFLNLLKSFSFSICLVNCEVGGLRVHLNCIACIESHRPLPLDLIHKLDLNRDPGLYRFFLLQVLSLLDVITILLERSTQITVRCVETLTLLGIWLRLTFSCKV